MDVCRHVAEMLLDARPASVAILSVRDEVLRGTFLRETAADSVLEDFSCLVSARDWIFGR